MAIVLNKMEDEKLSTVDDKVKFYTDANREVAILCNHQKTVSKNHSAQVEKLQEDLKAKMTQLDQLSKHLDVLKSGKRAKKAAEDPELKLPPTEEKTESAIMKLKKTVNANEIKLKTKVQSIDITAL